jgi:peroxiredoxin Q/BCP
VVSRNKIQAFAKLPLTFTFLTGMSMKILTLPTVKLLGSDQKTWSLPADLLNKWTLIYFYPKDDTPGCTVQACAYRDSKPNWAKKGLVVLGVSLDDLTSHDAFSNKFDLNFPLLADTEKVLSTALGAYGEQEWQGKKYMGLSRDSFLINPEGKIVKEWRGVNPKTTVEETISEALHHIDR